jgi:hypothetical protein
MNEIGGTELVNAMEVRENGDLDIVG